MKKEIIWKILLLLPILFITIYLCRACGPIIELVSLMQSKAIEEKQTWHEKTIPLSHEVITDICTNLGLIPTDPRCGTTGNPVYGPDFYEDLYTVFIPKRDIWATEEIVNEKLGTYLYKCEPYVATENNKNYRRCFYDFAGDEMYPFVFYFFEDGEIMELKAKSYN